MLDQVEALVTLKEAGTMSLAATRLRVTASAVSKRISALEAIIGEPLIEPQGRRVRLTPAGEALVGQLAPLLAQVRAAVRPAVGPGRPLQVGSSPALLASWLPRVLRHVREQTGVEILLHARRGPVVVERVSAGAYDLAVCVDAGLPDGLVVTPLGVEPMVVIGPDDHAPPEGPLDVLGIETASLTWQATARAMARHAADLNVVERVESFSVLVQLARAGFGHAVVPLGIAAAMGVPAPAMRRLPFGRPIAVVGRASLVRQPRVVSFLAALRDHTAAALDAQ